MPATAHRDRQEPAQLPLSELLIELEFPDADSDA